MSLADGVEAELVGDLRGGHGVGEILLVGENQQDGVAELILFTLSRIVLGGRKDRVVGGVFISLCEVFLWKKILRRRETKTGRDLLLPSTRFRKRRSPPELCAAVYPRRRAGLKNQTHAEREG